MDKSVASTESADPKSNNRKIILSEELFAGAKQVIIEHCGRHYRLLITKTGKLVLNK
ncbi:MAG: hemin uptake protein HemP [Candidatus Omnitrophica bacterium]|nr:hemin uptake protein HemP [Candidatus Omnitrophota bacterium]